MSSSCDSRCARPCRRHLQIVYLKRLNLLSLSGGGSAGGRWKGKGGGKRMFSYAAWAFRHGRPGVTKLKAFHQSEISFPICLCDGLSGVIVLVKPEFIWRLCCFSQTGEKWFRPDSFFIRRLVFLLLHFLKIRNTRCVYCSLGINLEKTRSHLGAIQ